MITLIRKTIWRVFDGGPEKFLWPFFRFRSAPWQKLWSDKVAMSFRQVLKRRKSNWQKCCSSFLFASCWLIYQHLWSKRWVWRKFKKFRILKFTELADSVWIILTNTVLSLYLEVLLHLIEALRHNEKSDTLYHFSPLKPTINSCGLA